MLAELCRSDVPDRETAESPVSVPHHGEQTLLTLLSFSGVLPHVSPVLSILLPPVHVDSLNLIAPP